jgi:transcriptional regulator with XRE-family HTH domain
MKGDAMSHSQNGSKRGRGKYDEAFGARVNQYRLLRGLEREEVGLGIHQSTSAGVRICEGKQTVYLDQIFALAELLGVPPMALIDFGGNPWEVPDRSIHNTATVARLDTIRRLLDELVQIHA